MAGTKNNRRTQYTIQALKEALLSLLQEKELAKITVTELCQRADINRGTFYLHFSDPLDLLKHVEADLMAQIRPVLAMRPQEQLHDWLQRFIYILKENADISRIVLNNYQDSRLIKEIFADVHDMALTEFTIIFDEQDPRLLE